MRGKETGKVLFLALALLVSGAVAVSFYKASMQDWEFEGFNAVVANVMIYYLIFSFARTIIMLIFSFLDLLFQRSLDEPEFFPLVTILVPCYNEEKGVEGAIKSVMEIDYPNKEILVLDDGSQDNTLKIAKKFEVYENVRVIYKQNSGKANSLNRGIEEALGDYVLCMDADSVLSKNVLKKAIARFNRDPKLAAVAGNVRVGNGSSLLALYQKLEYIIGLNFMKTAQSYLNIVNIVPGPIGVFKKEALLKVGMYDDDTFAEDADLSVRLLFSGYHIVYCAEMLAVTEVPEELSQLVVQRYRWTRGITQCIMKNLKWISFRNFNMRNFLLVSYMFLEVIMVPLINFIMAMVTIHHALTTETMQIMGPFFMGLTILDLTITLYTVITEKEVTFLVVLAVINRVTYGFAMEILRFFSLIDEVFKIPMKWGTLKRKGLT